MNYRTLSALAAITWGAATLSAQAGCKQSVPVRSGAPIVINLTTPLSDATTWSGTQMTQYPDSFTCDLGPVIGSNQIENTSMYSKQKLVINFNDGKDFLRLSVGTISPAKVTLAHLGGTWPGSRLNASFVMQVDKLNANPGGNQVSAVGNTYTVPNTVMAVDTTSHNLLWLMLQWAGDFLQFIFTGRWPEHDEYVYYQPVTLIYNRQATTCQLTNSGLTVRLPAVNTADLRQSTDARPTPFNLDFRCDYLNDGKTNRSVRAWLSSNNRLTGDNSTLVGDASSTVGGVGIRLQRSGESTPMVIGAPGAPSGANSLLFDKKMNDDLGATFSIPLIARYYRYDLAALSAGRLNTTAIVNFEYD